LRKVRGKQEKSRRPSVFNPPQIKLRPLLPQPRKLGARPKVDRLLICSLLFFDVFPKQPFRRYYTQPQPPPASRIPPFSAYFLPNPNPQNPPHFLSNPAAPGGGW
jgi:hypothetical protein